MPTSLPRRLALLATAALALPAAGCGSSSSSGSANADPATAIPASVPLYVEGTIQPTGKQKTDFEAAAAKILRTSNPSAKLKEIFDKATKDSKVTYDKDFKPWVGKKAAIAITSASGGGTDYAAVIASKDDGKAKEALKHSKHKLVDRKYNGVSYKFDASDRTAGGVVNHFAVIGTETGFKTVVDQLKGGKASLADAPGYKSARAKVGDKLGFLYVDLKGLLKTFGGTLGSSQANALGGLFGNLRAIGASLSADAQAVRFDIATVGSSAAMGSPAGQLPLESAPGDAWLAASQAHLGKTLSGFLDSLGGLSSGNGAQTVADAIKQFETATGLNVKEDLLSWMGDAGIFVKGDSLPELGGAIVIQSTDPAKTKAAIAKVKTLLRKFNTTLGPKPAGVSDGFTLPIPGDFPDLEVGVQGERFVAAIGKGALADALHPKSALGDDPNYKNATGLLEGGLKPSFYLNFQTVVNFVTALAGSSESYQSAKPYLEAFTAIVAGGDGKKTQIAIGLK